MRIGHYRIEETIAENGPVTVYRAVHEILQRPTLLKVYKGADPELIRRLEEEARIVAELESEHIAGIYDFGSVGTDIFYFAMEFIKEGNLRDFLARHNPDIHDKLALVHSILQAVNYIHQKGYIHRDLKPENILVNGNQSVRLTDFGISLHEAIKSHTPDQILVGTPLYMAPEQVNNLPINHQTDIFALGTIFYELFAGKNPFNAPSYGEIFARIITENPPTLHETDNSIPVWFSDLVKSMMQKEPSQRPESIGRILRQFETNFSNAKNTQPTQKEIAEKKENDFKGLSPVIGILLLVLPVLIYLFITMVKERLNTMPPTPATDSLMVRDTLSADTLNIPVAKNPSPHINNPAIPAKTSVKDTVPAHVWIEVTPWARVYVDYEYVDTTPLPDKITLKAGRHIISLQNPNYATWIDTIHVKSAQEKRLRYALDSLCYSMRLQVIPWGKVYVDDQYIGDTPLERPLFLTRRNKRLTIKNKFYKTYTESLDWRGNPVEIRKIILKKKQGHDEN